MSDHRGHEFALEDRSGSEIIRFRGTWELAQPATSGRYNRAVLGPVPTNVRANLGVEFDPDELILQCYFDDRPGVRFEPGQFDIAADGDDFTLTVNLRELLDMDDLGASFGTGRI
jgi:hypothetical protein